MIPAEHARALDERGYLRLPGFMPPGLRDELCARLEALFAAEGDGAGSEFKPEPGAGRLPGDVLGDPRAAHPDEVTITATAGDLIVMNAHLWHGGLANRTDRPRRAMHGYYCRWDKPQQQYQKRLLRPEVQARLSPAA